MSETEKKVEFDTKSFLRRTPEQLAEDKELQAAAAVRLKHLVSNSVAVAHYKTAVGAEKAIIAELQNLQDPALIDAACDRLAECFFWQGKFAQAVDVAQNIAKKNEYLHFKVAFLNLDLPLCICTTIQFASKTSAKGNSVPAKREIQRVYSAELDREIKFIKCEKCDRIFAVNL